MTITRKEMRPKYSLTKFTADLFMVACAAFFILSIALGSGVIK